MGYCIRYLSVGWWICCCMMMTACTVSSSLSTEGLLEADNSFAREIPPPKTVLAPGDEIEVRFRYWPELDASQTIRPDGKIALQLVGHVQAGGLTPEMLDARLIELYQDELIDPEIVTIVRSQAHQQVYVGGEVGKPGLVTMKPQMTVLEAIMDAGGVNKRSAELANVVIVRHQNNQRFAAAVNFKNALSSKDEVFYLAARDIVYVPRSKIDQLNQWVDQHINRLIPSSLLKYSVDSGAGTLTLGD